MPNINREQTPYIVTGNPDTMNVSPSDFTGTGGRPGELGNAFDARDKAYQIVQLDSGATAATPTGVVAANQLAFWKNKDNYIVTNDRRQAMGLGAATGAYRNFVAGIFRNAVTAGNYTCVLQRGDNIPVADGGNTFAAGESVIAEDDSAAAADRVAVGTASTFQILGRARGAASGGNVNVDIDITNIP